MLSKGRIQRSVPVSDRSIHRQPADRQDANPIAAGAAK